MVGHFVLALGDLGIQDLHVRVLEGLLAANHDVEQDAQAPPVDLGARVLDALQQLWRSIVRRADERIELHVRRELAAKPKVDDLDVSVGIEQDVLGLDVAVDQKVFVAVVHGRDDLAKEPPRLGLF